MTTEEHVAALVARPPMPLPHLDERQIETGRLCYPTFLGRVAAACAALNALNAPDPHGVESPYWAQPENGVIGLYNEETENEDDPHESLEGWLVPDGDLGWLFISRKPQWSEGTPSDRQAQAARSEDEPI